MIKTNLIPIHDTRKSFYGKAVVEQEGSEKKLYSYDTLVMTVKEINNNESDPFKRYNIEVIDTHSQTTTRHIREFLMQLGHERYTQSEINSLFIKN